MQKTGFKRAQKFREKWLLPPGKIGRSFIGQERSYSYRPGLVLNVAINISLYKIFIDSKGIFFFYYYNYLPSVYFLLIQLHVTEANYSWKFSVNFIWMATIVFYKHWYYWKCTQRRVCPHITWFLCCFQPANVNCYWDIHDFSNSQCHEN